MAFVGCNLDYLLLLDKMAPLLHERWAWGLEWIYTY